MISMPNVPARPSKLVMITLMYASAILAADFVSFPPVLLISLAAISVFLIWPLRQIQKDSYAVAVGIFCLGLLSVPISSHPGSHDISRQIGSMMDVTGQVASLPTVKNGTGRLILRVESIEVNGTKRPASGKLQVFFSPQSIPHFGERVSFFGEIQAPIPPRNPGQFSYRDYLARQHIYAILRVLDTDSVVCLGKPGWIAPSYWASMLRESMDQVIGKVLPSESAAILESMVFGLQGSEVSRDLEDDFRHSGTVHLLVVSGSQVMMLVVTLLWLCRRLLIPRKPTALIVFLMVVFYTLMTGGGSPVIRAAVAGSLAVWGMGLSRETDRWTLLAAAALFLLLLNPLEIHNSSFQLSFAAVIGLLAFTTPIYNLFFPPAAKKSVSRSFVSKGLHRIALLISISIAAQLTTAPLIAYYFQELTPVGVIANLAAVPLAGLLLPLGFLTAGFGSIWLPLGKLLGWADLVIIKLLVGWVQILAHLPSAYLDLPPVSVWILICWYGILFLMICRPGWVSRERLAVVGASCFLIFLIIWGFNLRIQQPLRGYFLSVGKGRSTLILTPSGKSILIDGGGPCFGPSSSKDYGQRVILPALKSLGIRKLDLMIACDGDLNHTAGLFSVAQQIPVRLALLSPSLKRSLLRQQLDRYFTPIQWGSIGQQVQFSDKTNLTLVGPAPSQKGPLSILVCYGNAKMMITGRLDDKSVRSLLEQNPVLKADLLQAEWRGSSSLNLQEFVDQLSPRASIINETTASPLSKYLKVHRSAIYNPLDEGAILLKTNGNSIYLQRFIDSHSK